MSIEGFQWDSKTSITTQGFACSLVHAQWLRGKVRATIEQDTSFTCKLPQQVFNDFLDNSRIIHHFQQAGKKMMVANTHKADVGCIYNNASISVAAFSTCWSNLELHHSILDYLVTTFFPLTNSAVCQAKPCKEHLPMDSFQEGHMDE